MRWTSVGLAIVGVAGSLAWCSPAFAQGLLGTAADFGVLAATTVTNTGATVVVGSVGVSPGSAVVGFPPGVVTGGTFHAGDATAAHAQIDVTTAYNTAAARPCPVANRLPLNVGGLTLAPGVYCFTAAGNLTGTLTLDFQGDPNAEFVFQIPSVLVIGGNAIVALTNSRGATCPPNVYWQVGSSANLGANSAFKGSILAQTSVTLNTGASLNGRVLARNGAATLDTDAVTSCDAVPEAEVSVSATSAPATVAPGEDLTYSVIATNQGPDAATDTAVTATLPSGLTFKSLVAPGGWACTTPSVGSPGAVNCTRASFAVGTASFTLTTTLAPGTTGSVPPVQIGVSSPTMDLDTSDDAFTASGTQVTVPPGPSATPVPPAATPTPTPSACTSRRSFTVQLKTLRASLRTARLVSARLQTPGGKALRKLRVTGSRVSVDLRGLKKQRLVVRVTARTRSGKVVRVTRNYGTCDLARN